METRNERQEITLKLDASYKVKHEKYESFSTSFFRKVYKQAAENVREIVVSTNKDFGHEEQKEYTEPISSIIAFDGKRGSGKTSAMLSFCDFLRDFNDYKEKNDNGVCESLFALNEQVSFTVLECIDATLVTGSKELMGAILGKMLTAMAVRERANTEISQTQNRDVRNLKTRLGEIYCSLKLQDTIGEDISAGEVLDQLSRSWNQQQAFRDSVRKFNKYMSEGAERKRHNYLVIPIDDVDMNLKDGYKLLETVRKYMMVPNVIVLLAEDTEQLEKICTKALRDRIGQQEDAILPQALALEYLEKLIPSGRRIHMPDLYREENLYGKRVIVAQETGESLSIKDTIIFNVWKYVGIILSIADENSHWLQPNSLRKLSNYVNSMRLLSEIEENRTEERTFIKNVDWFYEDLTKRYFNAGKAKYSETDGKKEYIGFERTIKEFENEVLAGKVQKLVEGLKEYVHDYAMTSALQKSANSYGNLLVLLYKMYKRHDRKFPEIWQTTSFILSLQMRRLIFSAEDWRKAGEDNEEFREVLEFSKGDFWGNMEEQWVEAWGKSKSKYQFECTISVKQLVQIEGLSTRDLLLLAIQMGVEENRKEEKLEEEEKEEKSGKKDFVGTFRFGNFINYVFDYKNRINKIVGLIEEKGSLPEEKKKELEKAQEELIQELDAWQSTYGTTRVIPFDSAEFMFNIFDELYGDQGVFQIFDDGEQYLQMYLNALQKIEDVLQDYDQYFEKCGKKELDKSSVIKSDLSREYASVYGECPFIKHMRNYDSAKSIIMEYIKFFADSRVVEQKLSEDETFSS